MARRGARQKEESRLLMFYTRTSEWTTAFFATVSEAERGRELREVALNGTLGNWTRVLTAAVVATCKNLGWKVAARNERSDALPVGRGEYLALDGVAFEQDHSVRWPFPHAVFELENSRQQDYISYALWKALCVKADLRMVFAYRKEPWDAAGLVELVTSDVIAPMSIGERTSIAGETALMIGSRGEAETFPYGYFKIWILNTNTGQFRRFLGK